MRLLKINNDGKIGLTKDLLGNDEVPPYAILSHTWQEGQEVTFNDLVNDAGHDKTGYEKIRFCMQQAAQEGLHHSWVDTCCINKADLTELQDAINSMFRWYRDAARCYVFLSDVSTTKRKADCENFQSTWEAAFRHSRWFTRGWTLQELLAPRSLTFFSRERTLLGNLHELKHLVHDITKLPIRAITGTPLQEFGVEERLSWSNKRTTTRSEDKAYSLLGIFGIFMPLIYGEGQENAFRRLRTEIQTHKYFSPGNTVYPSRYNKLADPYAASINFTEQNFGMPISLSFRSKDLSEPECLRSLSYPEQEQRYNEIHVAVQTCKWLTRDPAYQAWIQAPRGPFWIKGSPGVGKSVLMKHAVRSYKKRSSDELLASYFIHGQGTELQRTLLGVFRALLNSLLGHFPIHLSKLTTIFRDREERFGGYVANRWNWNCAELQEALSDVLLQGAQTRPITIYVDALDECGEAPARRLLAYFRDLARQVEEKGIHVKICLSSRHYPILGLDTLPSISVEESNSEDIRWYVDQRLRDFQPHMKRAQILDGISSKARGGFQWVFLITETLLNKSLAGIKADSLLKDLASCPETLGEMYAALLEKGTQSEKRQTLKLFQWVMFAEKPLSAQELREALATDADMHYTSITELRSQESWSDTLNEFERYVRNLSRGLIEFHSRELWEQHELGGEDWNRQAQLIHQSVADFLLERNAAATVQICAGSSHFQISRSCLRYLALKEVLNAARLTRGRLSSKFPLAPYAVRYIFQHVKKVEQAGLDQSDILSAMKWAPHSAIIRSLAMLWYTMNPDNIGTPIGWPFCGQSEFHVLAALGSKSALIASLADQNKAVNDKDAEGNTPLHIAIREGHHNVALSLLDQSFELQSQIRKTIDLCTTEDGVTKPRHFRKVDINAENGDGDTALDIAVSSKTNAVVLGLIRAGANLKYMGQEHMLVFHAISSANMTLLSALIAKNISLAGAVYFAVKVASPKHVISMLLKAGADTSKAHNPRRFLEDHDKGYRFQEEDYRIWDDALHLACRKGSTDMVDLLISQGVSATTLNEEEQCPLQVAVLHGHEKVVQSLLQHEPTAVEIKDKHDCTALTAAINKDGGIAPKKRYRFAFTLLKFGKFSTQSLVLSTFLTTLSRQFWSTEDGKVIIRHLLNNGSVDPNAKDVKGRSLLWYAATEGQETLVKLLFTTATLDLGAEDKEGISPLSAAARNGHVAMVQLLLTLHTTNFNQKDRSAPAAISEAASGQSEMAFVIKSRDGKSHSPLWHAAPHGQRQTLAIEPSLDNGPLNMDSNGASDIRPPSAALYARHQVVAVRLPATQKVDVSRPLLHTASEGHIHVIKLLLATGSADVNFKDNRGRTPLWLAALNDHTTVIELLLENANIDVNAVDASGYSPLNIAIQKGRTATVKILLAREDVIVSARDLDIYSPLHMAIRLGWETIAQALIASKKVDLDAMDNDGNSTLLQAVRAGHTAIVHQLLETGIFDVNKKNDMGQSALSIAVGTSDQAMCRLLLEKGKAHLDDERDSEGRSLLWKAVDTGNTTIVKMLLESGKLEVYRTGNRGWIPLSWASRKGDTAMVRLLLETGKIATSSRVMPLRWARRYGHERVVQLLLQHKS